MSPPPPTISGCRDESDSSCWLLLEECGDGWVEDSFQAELCAHSRAGGGPGAWGRTGTHILDYRGLEAGMESGNIDSWTNETSVPCFQGQDSRGLHL